MAGNSSAAATLNTGIMIKIATEEAKMICQQKATDAANRAGIDCGSQCSDGHCGTDTCSNASKGAYDSTFAECCRELTNSDDCGGNSNRVYCSTSTNSKTSSGCASSADCTINGYTGSVPLVKQEAIGEGCSWTMRQGCMDGCLAGSTTTLERERCTATCSLVSEDCVPGYTYTIYRCEYEGYIEYSGGYQS